MVMSMWESNSSVLTTGSCLVSAFIYENHCGIANGWFSKGGSWVAGDCRAVLGRSTTEDNIEAIQLTNDHNVREPAELKKLKEAHPSGYFWSSIIRR